MMNLMSNFFDKESLSRKKANKRERSRSRSRD